jgi:hypothetical protein
VLIQVAGVVITSSPGPTPQASRAMCSAEVPLFRPMQCRTPMNSANDLSKRSTAGPRMNCASEITGSSAACTCAHTDRFWALRSRKGTCMKPSA